MALHTLTVTDGRGDTTHLPDWAAQFVILIRVLRDRGWLARIAELLRVKRQGGYVGLDIFLFLQALMVWPRPDRRTRAIKAFDSACSFCRSQLAAVGGRRKWPGQRAVSRFLSAVPAGLPLLTAGAEMLRMGVAPLVSHPDAQSRDTHGQSWHVLDFDPTVLAIRQRALPEGEDLPAPDRRVSAIAAPGYSGRKRGEVQVSIGALQHEGSGLWLQTMAQPGNALVSSMLGAMLGSIGPWLAAADQAMDRAVVRADGAAGNILSLQAFAEHGVHYLTRLAWYRLLERPDVRAHLRAARWLQVPDSGSGPTRQAAEMGTWPWAGALPADAPAGLREARLVVTRFAADSKRGAGHLQEGWQYELFGTDLDASAWPAPELVELYYGRSCLENRFAQVMAELGLDKLFSTNLGGHWLVVLVGLFTWNLRTILGAQRAGPLPAIDQMPQPRRETVLAAPPPQPACAAEPEPVIVAAPLPQESQTPQPKLNSLLARLADKDWSAIVARHPGWLWHADQGLLCPAGLVAPPHRIRIKDGKSPALVFRTHERDCMPCGQRGQCFGGARPYRYQRDVTVTVAGMGLSKADLPRHPTSQHTRPAPVSDQPMPRDWQPPLPVPSGPWAVQPPRLVPSVLRAGLAQAMLGAAVRLLLASDEPPTPPPLWHARSAAQRQHRRLTWTQRLNRNALSPDARVDVRLTARDRWLLELPIAA